MFDGRQNMYRSEMPANALRGTADPVTTNRKTNHMSHQCYDATNMAHRYALRNSVYYANDCSHEERKITFAAGAKKK